MLGGSLSDDGRRTTDVGGQYFGDHKSKGMDAYCLSDLDGQWHKEQDGRYIVEKSRKYASEYYQTHHQQPGIALRQTKNADCKPVNSASLTEHSHKNHHAHDQPDDVPVHKGHRLFKVDDVQ